MAFLPKEIRAFLTEKFNNDDLYFFCYDDPKFQGFYNILKTRIAKTDFITELIDYAGEVDLLAELFKQAKEYIKRKELSMSKILDLESPGGTMRHDSPFYIERKVDDECWQRLNRTGATTLVIQGARQTGKSSLMNRMLYRAESERAKETVFIDFQDFQTEHLSNFGKFLTTLCEMISDKLKITNEVKTRWRTGLDKVSCGRYLADYIVPQLNKPLI